MANGIQTEYHAARFENPLGIASNTIMINCTRAITPRSIPHAIPTSLLLNPILHTQTSQSRRDNGLP
jgi:hypothetical protein